MAQPQHTQDRTLVDDDDAIFIVRKTAQHPLDAGKPTSEHHSTSKLSTLPPYIPYDCQASPLAGRTLVLCFDGTGDQFDNDNSNVVEFVSMLKKDDKTKQLVYYQAGIGTYTSPALVTPLMVWLSKLMDTMFAWNLSTHVMDGYVFLMQNYCDGDKICLFGFSRGAYTARCLAGMIHKVGIIPADNYQQVPFAHKMYTGDDENSSQANNFKLTFAADVNIEFVGVWDTVDSIGFKTKNLPFAMSNTIINTFRHAVSLDEHRAKFKPNLWNRVEKQRISGIDKHEDYKKKLRALKILDEECVIDGDSLGITILRSSGDDDPVQEHFQLKVPVKNTDPTDVEEVWFSGCHCDIGGGSVRDGTRNSLARIPLRWMVRECFNTKTGILFETASLFTIGLDPNTLYPKIQLRPPLSDNLIAQARKGIIEEPDLTWSRWFKSWFKSGSTHDECPQKVPFVNEEDEDLRDALSPIYDELRIHRLWWVVERLIPVTMRYQNENEELVERFGWNCGKARIIPGQHTIRGVKVHRSVRLRMEAQHKDGSKYKPAAKFTVQPTWISPNPPDRLIT